MGNELDVRFSYHKPDGEQVTMYEVLRGEAKNLSKGLLLMCPDNREREIAVQKIEEAVMWANASIAREPARKKDHPVGGHPY